MMSPEQRRQNLIAFFFGSSVATSSVTSAAVVTGASRRAYRDLNRTLHGIGSHPEAKLLREATDESLVAWVNGLASVRHQDEFDRAHDQWCGRVIDRYAGTPHPDREVVLRYGQAQKWINMTLKYLGTLGHPAIPDVYPFLHVPVDKVVLDQAKQLGVTKPRRASWSRLNRDEYLEYQQRLRKAIASTYSGQRFPLDWEAEVWVEQAPMAE